MGLCNTKVDTLESLPENKGVVKAKLQAEQQEYSAYFDGIEREPEGEFSMTASYIQTNEKDDCDEYFANNKNIEIVIDGENESEYSDPSAVHLMCELVNDPDIIHKSNENVIKFEKLTMESDLEENVPDDEENCELICQPIDMRNS
eukprot:TRINITY_DN4591_c0_g2_i1.p1 TRINITY_DN4591_c0_g2~~TRINITY_DN4591_c0_g2_i1.p1  ORF type:complete len:146 (-),score=45.80 TRINITY_DN4591_c0_g2_i1:187-624(-)